MYTYTNTQKKPAWRMTCIHTHTYIIYAYYIHTHSKPLYINLFTHTHTYIHKYIHAYILT